MKNSDELISEEVMIAEEANNLEALAVRALLTLNKKKSSENDKLLKSTITEIRKKAKEVYVLARNIGGPITKKWKRLVGKLMYQ